MEAEADFFGKKACIFSLIIGCVYMNVSVPVMHMEKKKNTKTWLFISLLKC